METCELLPEGGWIKTSKPRIDVAKPEARGPVFRTLSKAAKRFGRSEVPDIFVALHEHPGLFWPWLLFASRMMPSGKLVAKDRETCILRTAWNCRCRYEWGQHVDIALSVGITDQEIETIAKGPAQAKEGSVKLLLQSCDDLFQMQCIGDATWQGLAGSYSKKQRIELLILIGHYQMLAGFLNSAGLQLETSQEAVLQELQQRLASRAS